MKIPNIFIPEKDLEKKVNEFVMQEEVSERLAVKTKWFSGRNVDQMPVLIKSGMVPLNVADLMRIRLEVLTASEEVKDIWWSNYFGTGDAVFYHPNGNIKVVLNAEPLKRLNPKSNLSYGALVLPQGTYNKLYGEVFTRKEIRQYGIAGELLTKEEAKKNPIWKALAGGDQALLNAYVDAAFEKAKEDCYYTKLMRIGLSQLQKITTGRLWGINGLSSYSDAVGASVLDSDYGDGRLVGVTAEAHNAQKNHASIS